MYRRYYLPLVSMLGLLFLNATAVAEKAPLSAEGLQDEADLVVVATIEKIRIETEASQFEGAGNWDWAIYLTFEVESVEKGSFEGETLEARCFRIKSRRSAYEYLTPAGHYPIPEIGTRETAFLERRSQEWHVILPNGLAPISPDGRELSEAVPEARQVDELRSLMYTYLLPLEGWLLGFVVGIPLVLCVRWFWRRKHRGNGAMQGNLPVALSAMLLTFSFGVLHSEVHAELKDTVNVYPELDGVKVLCVKRAMPKPGKSRLRPLIVLVDCTQTE